MGNEVKEPSGAGANGKPGFGTFGGVFTPCILTLLGVIMYMRANFVVGEAGISGAIAILCISMSISLFTALSASAIATNMQVRGGGAYFLISRVLGPEFGGAIGIVLYLAQGVSVPFYVIGFTEALAQTFPALKAHYALVAFVTAGLLFAVAYVGAAWAIKVQYLIMATLAASIVAFMGGAALQFSPATFAANWTSGYTPLVADNPESGLLSFWVVLAIYFPAATGIMAGINMSGDLRDPGRSIPRGVIAALATASAVYLVQILLAGGAFSREALINRPYLSLKENALFGASMMVAAGMFAATLSSGLGSLLASPRVLQAVGRDGIVPVLRPFGRGSGQADEPRRALLLTGGLTAAILFWAVTSQGNALNLVAKTITMFFLYTYGMLNVAAFIEAVGENPSFRPRFRFFHWGTALAGSVGCIAVAFVISWHEALVAMLLLAGLVWYIHRRNLKASFGDARRGFVYKALRNNLIRLSQMEDSPKNWRPTAVVFSGNPDSREVLVTYAVWLEAGRGIVYLVNILVGRIEEYGPRRGTAAQQLKTFCEKRSIHAFPVVIVDEDLQHGMSTAMQSLAVGPIRPNMAVFGWTGEAGNVHDFIGQFRLAEQMGMSVVVLAPGGRPLHFGTNKRVDIWWRGMKNGNLMVLLAHLLSCNWEWERSTIRLLRHMNEQAAYEGTLEDLEQLVNQARVDARPEVIIDARPFDEILREQSSDADCVVLGFEIPEEGSEDGWYGRYQAMLEGMPTAILVCSVAGEDIMA